MKTRIITAFVALLILLPVLIFASFELLSVAGISITVLKTALAIVTAIAVFEAASCIKINSAFLKYPAAALSAFLILTTDTDLSSYTPVLILLFFFMMFTGVIKNDKFKADALLSFFAFIFYITVSFGALYLLFKESTKVLFPAVFVGAWVTDTFAYFSGYFFGRHKLIPAVSPKKTVEGAVGGALFCVIGFVVVGLINSLSPKSLILLAVIGLFASVVSQLGDLSASLIKRHWGIKDYGKLFPGHGGILDRFDSILSVSVFLYLASLIGGNFQ